MLAHLKDLRAANEGRCIDGIVRKIQILHSYGVDIHSKDRYGQGCLHTLLSMSIIYDVLQDEVKDNAMVITGSLSHLISMGADIHAVDKAGWSVTETAHKNRLGRLWEAALERSGLDVQQVYLDDHHSTIQYSDDIYAPDKDHQRQVRLLERAYYDSEDIDAWYRDSLLSAHLHRSENARGRVFDPSSTESSEHDSEASEWSEESIIEDYNEESHSSPEQHDQISGEDRPDASTEEEYSDEETGGVPVPV